MDNWEEKIGNSSNVLNLAAHQHEGEDLPPIHLKQKQDQLG
jgi:hypothetical protein